MESAPFRSSQQCRRFLSYVVMHTLNGDDGSLRERVIGSAVFGRPADYDTGDDPVVRLRASEVRKRLAQYYQSAGPREVRLLIPSGSYRATFLRERAVAPSQSTEHLAAAEPVDEIEPAAAISLTEPIMAVSKTAGRSTSRLLLPAVAIAAFALLVVATFFFERQSNQEKLVKRFWEPITKTSKPVLISVGSNAVYRVSDEVADKYSQDHHLANSGMEFFPDLSPDTTLKSLGMHPAPDSFVALGDVAAISMTVANLTRMQKSFQERFSNDISFAEIRSNPTILVGGFNNAMTRELTKNLRFVFTSRNRIDDRQQRDRSWVLRASQDSHDTEDYAIISRILGHDGSSPLISVAGLGQYGTLAATEFAFDKNRLAELDHLAAKDWRNRNIQILLHIKVNDFKPSPGEVVAVCTW